VINLAFASGDAAKNEREKVLFDTVDSFTQNLTSDMAWTELIESARDDRWVMRVCLQLFRRVSEQCVNKGTDSMYVCVWQSGSNEGNLCSEERGATRDEGRA
jgi:hypothetical protein